jgi:glycerol-3-phosphate dehydrogenase (NAD(P)+)
MKKITVLGAGAWGTTVAHLFAQSVPDVMLWSYEQEVADQINQEHINQRYLAGYQIAKNIVATTNLSAACENTEMIIEAVPMLYLDEVLAQLSDAVTRLPFLVTSKGVHGAQLLLPTHVLEKRGISLDQIVVCVGPTFAKEIMRNDLSGFCLASTNKILAEQVGALLTNKNIFVHYTNDLIGAQISGALKNIIALGIGILMGAGAGENLRALALVKGFSELCLYGEQKGARHETMHSIAGLGDLLLTSLSKTSKNFSAGFLRGEGKSRSEIEAMLGVLPEGCNTVKLSIENDLFFQQNMPFCTAVYRAFWAGEDASGLVAVLRA